MKIPDRPHGVIWDITYACPLRCIHCYSESGRRPARRLDRQEMLKVAERIIEMKPATVSLGGGEPLLVKSVFEVAQQMSAAGINVALYTGGWSVNPAMIDGIVSSFQQVSVSVDGATAPVHDQIRGRPGSFDRAMRALSLLDDATRKQRLDGKGGPGFGIDFVAVRSNFHQIESLCTTVAPSFPEMAFIAIGAVVPAGLASRPGIADHELLTDTQVALLGSREYEAHLRSLAPPSLNYVSTTANLELQMHPEKIRSGIIVPQIQIEPDGQVRAMPIYEGTIGNIMTESAAELWRRAVERWHHPFVVDTLTPVRSMRQWAEATRKIDYYFGSDEVRARLSRRADHVTDGRRTWRGGGR